MAFWGNMGYMKSSVAKFGSFSLPPAQVWKKQMFYPINSTEFLKIIRKALYLTLLWRLPIN